MHLSITYFCMLKDSLKLINHSLASTTGEILQGGTEPIKKPIFFAQKLWKYGIFRFILWILKMCLHSNISRFVQKIVELPQFIPEMLLTWNAAGLEGGKKNPLVASVLAGAGLLFFFYKNWHYSQQTTIFTQIVKNCETFPTVFKLGLESACNVSKVVPKNCWIPRDPKNALKCTKMLITTAGTEGEKNILKKAPGHLSITGVESLFFYKSGEGWLTTSTFQLALIKIAQW